MCQIAGVRWGGVWGGFSRPKGLFASNFEAH
jgi:hypothetical protein